MFICRACCKRALGSTSATSTTTGQLRITPQAKRTLRVLSAAPLSIRKVAPRAAPSRIEDPLTPALTDEKKRAIRWKVKKHLEFLDNNFNIAEHVERTLERGDYDEALLLVREASRSHNVVVSWNYLIGYLMRNGRLHAAIKLYNDMKKRDQMPNAQTYTILFRGFAKSEHPKLAVSEAVRIYHSMLNSQRLQPNIIHMNAVLDVCRAAGDLDSLWSIVSTADDKLRSPDDRTYTIILIALRPKIPTYRLRMERPTEEEDDPEADVGGEAVGAANMAVINQAKAIWEEVIGKWRKAKLVIDERLVCAMGRMLLHGGREENDEILDLVEQTMCIPRQDKVTGSLPLDDRPKPVPAAGQPSQSVVKAGRESLDRAWSRIKGKPRPADYAVPGTNTLSLILESIRATRKTSLGPKYWDLFVNDFKVEPDQENYHTFLRLLRVGNASTRTADVIQSMPVSMLMPKTFRISLSCCVRDNLNRHAFANATRIFKAMKGLRHPDAMAMRLYLQAARANFRPLTANMSEMDGKLALGRQITIALDNMWEPFGTLTRSFSFSSRPTHSPEEAWERNGNEQMEAMALAKKMVAAMDFVVTEGAAEDDVIKQMKPRRNVLNRYVTMFLERRQKMERSTKFLGEVEDENNAPGAAEPPAPSRDTVRRKDRV